MIQGPRKDAPEPYHEGYRAFHKEASGTLTYNPYDPFSEATKDAHNWWDNGYQDALDDCR